MIICEPVAYSGRPESLITLYECPSVSTDDIASMKHVIPDQVAHVENGDKLTIYIVDNRIEEIKGVLTVWHVKGRARMNTGHGNIWGDWEEDAKLLVTEEFVEDAEDGNGREVMGRIAYNTHGMRGIYSRGKFFTLLDSGGNELNTSQSRLSAGQQ